MFQFSACKLPAILGLGTLFTLGTLGLSAGTVRAAQIGINLTPSNGTFITQSAFGVDAADWINFTGTNPISVAGGSLEITTSAYSYWQMDITPVNGEQQVANNYLDDRDNLAKVTISGLSSISGGGSYSVKIIMASDAAAGFTDSTVTDGDNQLLGTLTQDVYTVVSGTKSFAITTGLQNLVANIITIEPGDREHKEGDANTHDKRGTVAGVIITISPIPEPGSISLLVLAGGMTLLRRRKAHSA